MRRDIHFISFATDDFRPVCAELEASVHKYGFKHFTCYRPQDLVNTEWYSTHRQILEQPRGAGYWLWKPYLILEKLKSIGEGEIVFYADAASKLVNNPKALLTIVRKNETGLVIFDSRPERNISWTKRDAFILTGCDEEKFRDGYKCIGGAILLRNSGFTREFISQWLEWCSIPGTLNDAESKLGTEFPGYREHRHDQAILSLLVVKHNIETYRNPSPWGNFLKLPGYRVKGEFVGYPFHLNDSVRDYSAEPQKNSPYHTILEFNRLRPNSYIHQPAHGWAGLKMRLGYLKKKIIPSRVPSILPFKDS